MRVSKSYKHIKRNFKRFSSQDIDRLSQNKLAIWSREVRTRDSFTCKCCGSKKRTQAHHLLSKIIFPELAYNINIGITLCRICHIGYRGVHKFNTKPKNAFIEQLRIVFKKGNLEVALKFSTNSPNYSMKRISLRPRILRKLYRF